MDELGVEPARFVMIGNSVRSDVLPVVELGGRAVHLPYTYTWAHEQVLGVDPTNGGYQELSSIRDLPPLIEAMATGAVGGR